MSPRLISAHGSPLMVLTSPANRTLQLLFKRIVDVLGAIVGLTARPLRYSVSSPCPGSKAGGRCCWPSVVSGPGGNRSSASSSGRMRADAEEVLRRDPALYSKYVANNFKLPDGEDPRITPSEAGHLGTTSLDGTRSSGTCCAATCR